MLVLLDTHDIVTIMERNEPCNVVEFSDFLRKGGRRLVLCPTVIKEVAAPLVELSTGSDVFQTLRKLETLPLCYFSEAKAVYEELKRSAVAFNEGSEPRKCDSLFADRIDGVLPLEGRVETEFYLRYSLSESVWELWRSHPELLRAPQELGDAFRTAVGNIRSMANQSKEEVFVLFAQNAVVSYDIPVEISRFKAFGRWLWESPERCPAVRMNFEVWYQLILNVADKTAPSDIFDLTFTQALPYVDAVTVDRRMKSYVERATRALDGFCRCAVYASVSALMLEDNTESGSRGYLTPGPHTTQHAGPHWAVHDEGAHDSLKHIHGLSSNNRGR